MEEFITKSGDETEKLGEEFAKQLKSQDAVFLIGDLGSGKTTFTKGLAKGLNINDRIISPTFVIVRQHRVSVQRTVDRKYETQANVKRIETLYHLDLYRLGGERDVKGIDLKDFLDDKSGVVVIEWPEIGQNLVDKKVWKVNFEHLENDGRKISISYE